VPSLQLGFHPAEPLRDLYVVLLEFAEQLLGQCRQRFVRGNARQQPDPDDRRRQPRGHHRIGLQRAEAETGQVVVRAAQFDLLSIAECNCNRLLVDLQSSLDGLAGRSQALDLGAVGGFGQHGPIGRPVADAELRDE
jgi:hypothetical protein